MDSHQPRSVSSFTEGMGKTFSAEDTSAFRSASKFLLVETRYGERFPPWMTFLAVL